MSTVESPVVDNGVNVEALLGARQALAEAPEAAQFRWRARCEWVNGTHSRTTVHDFFGLGAEHTHKSPTVIEGDHDIRGILGADPDVRNGFTGVRVRYEIDADADRAAVEALVAQSQKRSAVFDILTNPTAVTVEVA